MFWQITRGSSLGDLSGQTFGVVDHVVTACDPPAGRTQAEDRLSEKRVRQGAQPVGVSGIVAVDALVHLFESFLRTTES